jgi:hypothetical protein
MYCAGGIVLSKNLTLCLATSNSYLSPFYSSCMENSPEMSGIWCVAKAWKFQLFSQEDYYV